MRGFEGRRKTVRGTVFCATGEQTRGGRGAERRMQPRSLRRIPPSPPTKNALLSTDKGAFFELSVPLTRNVKYASQVKRTSCVKCAFGTLCGTLNFTAPKEQLHYAARYNFTAACRNFTFDDIQGFALIYLKKCGIMREINKGR